ncbi:MAG: hypothetical protein KG028_05530 [Actinobacteria bacterium]|nr:hypothetical protein [Actinomycetota bacterium]
MSSASSPSRADASTDLEVRTPARVHRRRAVVLLALAVFQFWLWGTRIYNLLGDSTVEYTLAFVLVHLVLYAAAIGAGVVLTVLGLRMWREARAAGVGS